MATRQAAKSVDWTTLFSKLGLGKETISGLQTFRSRHLAALNKNGAIKGSIPEIDLAHYRSILKDQTAVEQAQKILADFKPVDYDVKKWDQAVETFQGKAVSAAKETVTKIAAEEKSLQETLSNIKDARPFEQLTIHDVAKARPEVQQATDTMLKKGKWTVPGYREKFGDFSLM